MPLSVITSEAPHSNYFPLVYTRCGIWMTFIRPDKWVSRSLLLCCSIVLVDIIETVNCRYEPDTMSSNDHVIILDHL